MKKPTWISPSSFNSLQFTGYVGCDFSKDLPSSCNSRTTMYSIRVSLTQKVRAAEAALTLMT